MHSISVSILLTHCSSRRKKQLNNHCVVRARKIAYKIVAEQASLYYEQHNSNESIDDKMSSKLFDLPNTIIKCAVFEENTGMHPYISKASDRLLEVFQKNFLKCEGTGVMSESQVAPMLPSLLYAVCADSSLARLIAAKWVTGFVHDFDPLFQTIEIHLWQQQPIKD